MFPKRKKIFNLSLQRSPEYTNCRYLCKLCLIHIENIQGAHKHIKEKRHKKNILVSYFSKKSLFLSCKTMSVFFLMYKPKNEVFFQSYVSNWSENLESCDCLPYFKWWGEEPSWDQFAHPEECWFLSLKLSDTICPSRQYWLGTCVLSLGSGE